MSAKDIDEIEEASKISRTKKNLPAIDEWCSTGCSILDFAIANQFPGGIPVGRIVQTYGGTSTCKTVLAVTVSGYAQRSNKRVYYADVEHTLDPTFSEIYGLDCYDSKTFESGFPTTLEELFDEYISGIIIKKKATRKNTPDELNIKPKLVIVDSITALPAEVETKDDMKDGTFGTMRAKQMSKGFRKYCSALAESKTTLFCVDQTRDNIGSAWGGEVTSGGRALEFYSSVRIYLKMDSKIVNSLDKVVGNWIKFRIDKNKVGPPLREGRFRILYDYGLDDISTNLYFLSEYQNGPQAAKNKTTKIKYLDQESKMSTAVKYIEEHNKEEELRKEVWEVWQATYKGTERKVRKW